MIGDAMLFAGLRLLESIAADMQRLYRGHVVRMWVVRGIVLANVVVATWDLSDPQTWVRWVSLLPMWGAWHAFRTSERFAGDLPLMRAGLADVREKIRTAKEACK